jgi:hypothetical protein
MSLFTRRNTLVVFSVFLLSISLVAQEIVSVVADRKSSSDLFLLDRSLFSLQKALSASGIQLAPTLEDEALLSLLTEWSRQGDAGERDMIAKMSDQKLAEEIIFCSLSDMTFRVWWLDKYGVIRGATSVELSPGISTLELDRRIMLSVKESLLSKKEEKWANRLLLGSLSFILPGTGHLMRGERLKGGLILGGAGISCLTGVLCFLNYSTLYERSYNAPNTTLREYYYNQSQTYLLGAIISGVLYLGSSIFSSIDILASP